MSESKTVLIIDDDSGFCEEQFKPFWSLPATRSEAQSNGRDGLQLAKTAAPDLILLDVMMTERTEGFFVLQEMRRIPALSQTPVIVVVQHLFG